MASDIQGQVVWRAVQPNRRDEQVKLHTIVTTYNCYWSTCYQSKWQKWVARMRVKCMYSNLPSFKKRKNLKLADTEDSNDEEMLGDLEEQCQAGACS